MSRFVDEFRARVFDEYVKSYLNSRGVDVIVVLKEGSVPIIRGILINYRAVILFTDSC
jgi:hypothetical protein